MFVKIFLKKSVDNAILICYTYIIKGKVGTKKMNNKLKKMANNFFMGLAVMMIFLIIPAIAETYQHRYTQICTVYEVTDNYTTFIDPCGYLWDVNDTNYELHETVKIYFDDNLTDFNREDDIIRKVKRVD